VLTRSSSSLLYKHRRVVTIVVKGLKPDSDSGVMKSRSKPQAIRGHVDIPAIMRGLLSWFYYGGMAEGQATDRLNGVAYG
jgi:hypothetical protein